MKYQAETTFVSARLGRVRRGTVIELTPGAARQLLARGRVSPYTGPQEQVVTGPTEIKPVGTPGTFVARCGDCGSTFNTVQGLRIHTSRMHKAETEPQGLAD